MNQFKTVVLMTALLVLFMLLGEVMGGRQGMMTFFFFGLATNFISYWFSDKIILMMSGAKKTEEKDLPQVYAIVRELTQKWQMPMPKIYLMETPVPNAFATGRNPEHAAVAVTTGILQILDDEELRGVLGHELGHVKNRDILISTVAAAIAGAIMMMTRMAMWFGMGRNDDRDRSPLSGVIMIAVAILAPIAAMLIQMAISRAREFQADKTGSDITGTPLALASALQKLETGVRRQPQEPNPATAHLYIVSPLTGRSFFTLFSTHPSTAERVQRLKLMAQNPSTPS